MKSAVLACMFCGLAWGGHAVAQTIPRLPPPGDVAPLLSAGPAPARMKDAFTFAAAGDLIISAPMADENVAGLRDTWRLLRGADLAFANMETPPVDASGTEVFPNGDALLRGPATLAADARAMGFGLLSLANNHAADLGPAAVLNTRTILQATGIAVAGSGPTLEEARAPGVASTPKGRVALVATASTFKPNSMAQDAQPDWPNRPGLSVLHVKQVSIVSEAEMAALRPIAIRQSYGRYLPPRADASEITLNGATYRVGPKPGVAWEMNPYDRFALLKAVSDARRSADMVVFAIHAHESDSGIDDDNPKPADFLPRLFHDAVDAGADVVVGGGPHTNRGVEIYKGKPIFYGMGLFTMTGKAYFSQEAQIEIPADTPTAGSSDPKLGAPIGHPREWLESMVALSDFENGRLMRVRIYPLTLKADADPAKRGRPIIAQGGEAVRLLKLLQRDSQQFGTRIDIVNGVGLIELASQPH